MNEQLQLLSVVDDLTLDDEDSLPEGSHYATHFLSDEQQCVLLGSIDRNPWLGDLRRRVQHYGFKYDYSQRDIDSGSELGPLPIWLDRLEQQIRSTLSHCELHLDLIEPFNQAIVNEYLPGQGIAQHTDRNCFGPVVATVSLGSDITMDFAHPGSGETRSHRLSKGSLLAMSGAARWTWRHGIAKRKADRLQGGNVPRERRVSITFRTVSN